MTKCNVSYKDEETKVERICQTLGGEPNEAKYERSGLYVCQECYPDVVAYLSRPFGRFGYLAVAKAMRRL